MTINMNLKMISNKTTTVQAKMMANMRAKVPKMELEILPQKN